MSITDLAFVTVEDGAIIAGADTKQDAEQIATRLQEFLPSHCTRATVRPVDAVPADQSPYAAAVRNPDRSDNYHLLQGCSRWDGLSFIDWWTFLSAETRNAMMEELYQQFVGSDHVTTISERGDVGYALEQCFPAVGQHGLHHLIGDRVWTYLGDNHRDTLSEHSERALNNGENGAAFENYFARYCRRTGLTCYKPSAPAFRRYMPDTYQNVNAELGSTRGIPDFFVDKQNTHTLPQWMNALPQRRWEPDDRYAFVEVKYNTSTLSPRQRTMIDVLTGHDVEVWLLQGTETQPQFTRAP